MTHDVMYRRRASLMRRCLRHVYATRPVKDVSLWRTWDIMNYGTQNSFWANYGNYNNTGHITFSVFLPCFQSVMNAPNGGTVRCRRE